MLVNIIKMPPKKMKIAKPPAVTFIQSIVSIELTHLVEFYGVLLAQQMGRNKSRFIIYEFILVDLFQMNMLSPQRNFKFISRS